MIDQSLPPPPPPPPSLSVYLQLHFSLVSFWGKGFRVLNRVVGAGAAREFEKWIRECGCAREARARSGSGGI